MAGRCAGMLVPLNSFFPFKDCRTFHALLWSASVDSTIVLKLALHLDISSYETSKLSSETLRSSTAIATSWYPLGFVIFTWLDHCDKSSHLHPRTWVQTPRQTASITSTFRVVDEKGVLACELLHRLLYSITSSAGHVTLPRTGMFPTTFSLMSAYTLRHRLARHTLYAR